MFIQTKFGRLINLNYIAHITPWYGPYDRARITYVGKEEYIVNNEQEYLEIKDAIEKMEGIL